jgi:hypothetical protein
MNIYFITSNMHNLLSISWTYACTLADSSNTFREPVYCPNGSWSSNPSVESAAFVSGSRKGVTK